MTAPTIPTDNGPDSWDVKKWITFLHNASTVPQSDPSYALARQDMADAVAHIDALNQQKSADDPERLRPGALSTFMVALGNGASLGLLGNVDDTKMYLQAGREAGHGTAATLGNLTGFGATTALTGAGLSAAAPALSATASGALSGAATGAIQGAASTPEGRGAGALMGAGIGAITGGAGGFIAGKTLPFLQRSALLGRFFGGSEIDAAEGVLRKELQQQGFNRADIAKAAAKWRSAQADEAAARAIAARGQAMSERVAARGGPQAVARANIATEAQIRRYLEGTGRYAEPGKIDEMIQGWRETGELRPMTPATSATPAAPTGGTSPIPNQIRAAQDAMGRPLTEAERDALIVRGVAQSKIAPLEGTAGRGFEVTGTRATPPIPTEPTLLEMQQGITKQGMARAAATSTPTPGTPTFQGKTLAQIVREGEQQLGRRLTASEIAQVREQFLGRLRPKPSHPIWYGGGSPTIKP